MSRKKQRAVLLVDGYNVLGAWPTLMKNRTISDARDELIQRLSDYAGYTGQRVILVFDAWLSGRKLRTNELDAHIEIVFTQHGETADHYIERTCDTFADDVQLEKVRLRVASSDGVEQTVVFGRGAVRISSRELINEMHQVKQAERRDLPAREVKSHPLMRQIPDDVREKLERMRRGEE